MYTFYIGPIISSIKLHAISINRYESNNIERDQVFCVLFSRVRWEMDKKGGLRGQA